MFIKSFCGKKFIEMENECTHNPDHNVLLGLFLDKATHTCSWDIS